MQCKYLLINVVNIQLIMQSIYISIFLLIYNILSECTIQQINTILLALYRIHPMPFLYHVHNVLYNVGTTEEKILYYYFIDQHSTPFHYHVGLYRRYEKVGIYRAVIYLENIHLLKNVFVKKYAFQNKMKCFSFLVLITYYYTLNLYKITQNQPDTTHNTLISNTYHSNMHILIIYILKMVEICMYNIVLLYNQLYSYIMIYTNVLCIVHWCTYMYMHLYSDQYFFTSSIDHSLCLYKGKAQGGRAFYYVHPWVYQCYFDFG